MVSEVTSTHENRMLQNFWVCVHLKKFWNFSSEPGFYLIKKWHSCLRHEHIKTEKQSPKILLLHISSIRTPIKRLPLDFSSWPLANLFGFIGPSFIFGNFNEWSRDLCWKVSFGWFRNFLMNRTSLSDINLSELFSSPTEYNLIFTTRYEHGTISNHPENTKSFVQLKSSL